MLGSASKLGPEVLIITDNTIFCMKWDWQQVRLHARATEQRKHEENDAKCKELGC